ncbi:hypothetical protein [Actinomadura oligospora]|uniref:hypothetical protein n=1 Tax=Actinomadura oligospora TaxID=111804 RepID=UPI00047BF99E|nr:hypothetical protein [Actinomadura oligospora]
MRESVAVLAVGAALTLSPMPALLASTPARASTVAPVPAHTSCTGLTGAAAAFFNQSALCHNLSQDLLDGRPDKFGTELRDSLRRLTPPGRMYRPEARHRVVVPHQRPPARPSERPRRRPEPKAAAPKSIDRDAHAPDPLPLDIVRPRATPSHSTVPHSARPVAPQPSANARAVPEGEETQSFGMLSVLLAGLVMCGVFLMRRRAMPVLASAIQSPLRLRAPRLHRRATPRDAEDASPGTPPPPVPAVAAHHVPPARPAPDGVTSPVTAVQVAAELARPSGVGLVGDGVDGFVRAVVTELVTRDGPRARVVLSRTELDRLYGGAFDEPLRSALEPELRVCELLEDAIEHLELEMLISDAEQANPDLSPTRGVGMPTIYWIATPGHDDDVVLPLVRRGPAHRPVGIMFGVWTHGRTCSVDADGTLTAPTGPRRVPLLTVDESLAALRAHASTERTGWL